MHSSRMTMPARACAAVAFAAALVTGACSDGVAPRSVRPNAPPPALLVSEPVALPAGAAPYLLDGAIVFVAFRAGTFPAARSASITTSDLSRTVVAPVVDGGLDPLPVPAAVGDTIRITISSDNAAPEHYEVVVPVRRRPRVIRTVPPADRADLPLNSVITIVFSEPLAPGTVDSTTIYLEGTGGRVPVAVTLDAGGLRATLVPIGSLPAADTLTLAVTQHVTDLAGDALETSFAASFATGDEATPTEPPEPLPMRAARVFAGGQRSCLITTEGQLQCWGKTWTVGFQFTETPIFAREVVDIGEGRKARTVSIHETLTCFSTSERPMLCSGVVWMTADHTGFLSAGRIDADVSDVVALSAGGYHTCALTGSGTLRCWGQNEWGQLGAGRVYWVTDITIGSPYSYLNTVAVFPSLGRHYRDVAAGGSHTCALTSDSLAYCWGAHGQGQLGVPDAAACSLGGCGPVGARAFVDIAAGTGHSCALDREGAAWCWGANGSQQLGEGVPPGTAQSALPVRSAAGPFTAVVASGDHTCALDATGAAWCWGSNQYGQLGDASYSASRATPAPVAGGVAFVELAAGFTHTCGRTSAGEVYCWGDNSWGQVGLGYPDRDPVRVPTRVY